MTTDPPEPDGKSGGADTGDQSAAASSAERPKIQKRGGFARELPFLILVAFLLALLIKTFVVQAFYIPSGSMELTLHGCPGCNADRVLVNKLVYRFRDVRRGEIVVFNGKGTGFAGLDESQVSAPSNGFERIVRDVQGLLGLGAPGQTDFIKRVIGVGGDTVACCDAQGRITVNGSPLNEPYVYQNSPLSATDKREFTTNPVHVPKGQLFVMGDHRDDSSDSRAHGTIPTSAVIGRAFVRIWPLNRCGLLTVPSTFSHVSSSKGSASPSLPIGPAVGLFLLPPRILSCRRRRQRHTAAGRTTS